MSHENPHFYGQEVAALKSQLKKVEEEREEALHRCERLRRQNVCADLAAVTKERDALKLQLEYEQANFRECSQKLREAKEARERMGGELVSAKAQTEKLREVLRQCKDFTDYSGTGEDRPHNRLVLLIEARRRFSRGDNWLYWNYLSEKLQALPECIVAALAQTPAECLQALLLKAFTKGAELRNGGPLSKAEYEDVQQAFLASETRVFTGEEGK